MAESPIDDDELTAGYKAPAEKPVSDIVNMDQDDESLQKYKKSLLGDSLGGAAVTGKRDVTFEHMIIAVEGREDICLDLSGDCSKLKNTPVILKEKAKYHLKFKYFVKGDIVAGLQMKTVIKRMGKQVEKFTYMLGSFPPQEGPLEFTGKEEEAPGGMVHRGKYTVHCKFFDDDKNKDGKNSDPVPYLDFTWALEIKKHWPEEKEAKE